MTTDRNSEACRSGIPVRLAPLAAAIRALLAGTCLAGAGATAGELPVPGGTFASVGRADQTTGGNRMTINQYTDRAVLNWQSFNVGKDSSVHFKQPSASSIALNRIHQNDPSRIFGKVTANGQIYLLNQNGFLFGKDARVDVNTLVASTLDISDDTFQRGITKVLDQDGRAALTGKGEVYRRDGQGRFVLDENGKRTRIAIQFQAGSSVKAAKSGRIIAAAPKVENEGNLAAPDGQILLIAGTDKVYLQEAGSDSGLRGLLVEVGTGGEVSNVGKLLAERGNVTLMGFAVNQKGRVSATTSVQANGSVRLLAREGGGTRREENVWLLQPGRTTRTSDLGDGLGTRARVILGSGSTTEATPDLKDQAKAVDGQPQPASRMEIMGQQVRMERGATVRSLSGRVTATATGNPASPGLDNVKNDSRIYIDPGAIVDVSGVDGVSLPMDRNLATVELRSNELRDSPLQRNGVLYGQKVQVDLRQGTPIADITGALERIARTVAERSSAGGSLDLVSEGDVVVRAGARLDFSGGSVFYRPGYINTTQLVKPDGGTVDIGAADPNQHYTGILGRITRKFPAWHVTKTWDMTGPVNQGRFEPGYVDGKAAGSLSIKAAALALDGEMRGSAVAGIRQRSPDLQPAGGKLDIDLARSPDATQSVRFHKNPATLNVAAGDPFPRDPADAGQPAPLVLSGDRLKRSGITEASIATNGKIAIHTGETLALPGGGSLALSGGEIAVDGAIVARSGRVRLGTHLTGADAGKLSGAVTLGSGAAIDASGGWINDRPAASDGRNRQDTGRILVDGGTVTVSAEGDVHLAAGSRIDVGGGGRRTAAGGIEAGDAGGIALEAAAIDGSDLSIAGSLQGYALAGGRGGSLSLTSDQVILGGAPAPTEGGPKPLVLAPDFFGRGGFQKYSVASNKSGVTVADGTDIALSVQNRVLDSGRTRRPSGSDLRNFSHVELLPEATRPAGELELSLAQKVGQGGKDAAVGIGSGARLGTDAGGKFTLSSDSGIFLDGTLSAPAGRVAMTITPPAGADPGFLPGQGIWLGAGAGIDVAGKALLRSDALGQTTGEVLPGGSIALRADRGFVVAAQGSVLDVSGTSATLSLPVRGPNGAIATQSRTIASAGGSIEVRAAEGIGLYGDLQGRPGAPTGAEGGQLGLELNPRTRNEPDQIVPGQLPFPKVPSVIAVTPSDAAAVTPVQGEAVPPDQYGRAALDPARLQQGGFSSLVLRTPDRIEFGGEANLKIGRGITLDAPELAFQPAAGTPGGTVRLESPYVALGSTQTRPDAAAPTSGTGSLEVRGGLVDLVGTSVLKGFGAASLASSGDLRLIGIRTTQQQRDFLGEFLSAGDLTLEADQIYPATLSDFRVAVQGKTDGVLTVQPGDSAGTGLLSAGGRLTLEAPTVVQGGTVKAPLGTVNLNATDRLELADGSVTSNSAPGTVVPFGRTQGGLDWIYPLGEQNLVFTAPPEKRLSLAGKDVDLAAGALVDTSGGGDLFAFEFVPGPGGSRDLLDPSSTGYRETYAVLPGYKGSAAPHDPLELPGSGLKVGDSVYLSGGGGLKAGNYVLLPAHYALLPGAYLVTPEPDTTDLVPGRGLTRGDGAPLVAGYRTVAGTGFRDARWSGFAVEKGDAARLRGEYSGHQANAFFADKAKEQEQTPPALPRDAGAMLIAAETGLNLDSRVAASAARGGRGGRLDIKADDIVVVAASHGDQPVAGGVRLVAENLNALGVASIALGGVRGAASAAGTVGIRAEASNIRLEPDARLTGREFILAAKNEISLSAGSAITASGPAGTADSRATYTLDGDAAFVRVSSSGQADLHRTNATGRSGSIAIGPGAGISASGSMMVDATANTRLDGTLETRGGSVALGASRISLGDGAATANDGLVLTSSILGSLKVDELILSSGSDISLFGAVNLKPRRLVLRSGGLLGYANAGQTANLRADDIRFENPFGASSDRQGDGTGNLSIAAKTIELGAGSYRLQGYSAADFRAAGTITGEGAGTLTAAADLRFTAQSLTGGPGAHTTLDARGHGVSLQTAAAAGTPPAREALGARLSITADGIRQAGTIALPSGGLKLDAVAGDLVLAGGSSVDVSGRTLTFGKSKIATDGGQIELSSETGNVILEPGASLKLGGNRGGQLSVVAPDGGFTFLGTADARGTGRGGRFELDTGAPFDSGNLGGLAAKLSTSGFGDEIRVRARSGDLRLAAGESVDARSIQLTADQGAVRIQGALNAHGAGAEVNLRATDALSLAPTAGVRAEGTPDQGGKVLLESLDADGDGRGGITVDAGATFDLRAADGSANGVLSLRAARTGQDVAVGGNLRLAVTGAKETTVEAVRTYSREGTIAAADISAWKADTAAYMAGASAIETRLGLPGSLRPGLEIRSGGDLTVGASGWDLIDWRYDGRPGVLTLGAGRNLTLAGKLSDGFKDDSEGIDLSALLGPGRSLPVKDMLQPGQSWSYRLAAGGDVTVGSDVVVRTGTGDIRMDAGQDLVLGNAGSAIYTAGRPTETQRYGSFKNGYVGFQFYGEYPVDGGDIAIAAGRDVIGARTGQFFDGWMVRTGNWTRNADHRDETPTAWGLAIGGPVGTANPQGSFRQNLGALGGGNITVDAGRNVTDLSAVIPTTGKQVGQPTRPDDPSDTGFSSNQVLVTGGGNLSVTAGGDVAGGTFYTGRGTGEIAAAGSITGSPSAKGLGPVVALGDARFSLQAGGGITLGAAINPTVLASARGRNFFFTYSAASGLGLQALAGDVEFQNDIAGMIDGVNALRPSNSPLSFPGSSQSALSVYPASLKVAALQGDIAFDRSFIAYPAASAGFSLFAGGDITTARLGDNVNITQSDADPSLLPGVDFPATGWEDATQRLQAFGDSNLIHAQVPVHRGDPDPARIYAQGNIAASDPLLFSLPKAVDVHAGKDLSDVSFQVQHPDHALSGLSAGRDIRFTSPRNPQGNLVNLTREVRVAGPGQLWVTAGRNVDLGASEGIYTIGNTNNRALAEDGASISVLAGLGDAVHYEDFAKKYDPLSDRYAGILTTYLRKRGGDAGLARAGAAAAYRALPEEQRREFLLTVLFTEIRAAAAKAARTGRAADYDPGFRAINALFPGAGTRNSKYLGDLKLFFSKIHTVDGGDINLLVPGGEVNAGLAVAFAGAKPASDLGIVAQRSGAVNAVVDGNFLVNQSRVFAMDGGDITLWSSNGNIDAGRGAKSAIAAPPPIVSFDERGNLQVEFPPVVSGSGIRTAASIAPRPGDVYLAAPRGVVDAGEAGIGGTNITIAATAVIGASNIDVGGTASGVPSANVAVPVAPAGATAAAAAATQTAQQNASNNGDNPRAEKRKQLADAARMNPLTVEVLGFGECGVADIRNGKPGCV